MPTIISKQMLFEFQHQMNEKHKKEDMTSPRYVRGEGFIVDQKESIARVSGKG